MKTEYIMSLCFVAAGVATILGIAIWNVVHYRAMKKRADLPAPESEAEPVKPPEPLIFGSHHFIQYAPFVEYSAAETYRRHPWVVQRYTFTDEVRMETKEQAIELMKRADAYRDFHLIC